MAPNKEQPKKTMTHKINWWENILGWNDYSRYGQAWHKVNQKKKKLAKASTQVLQVT